MRSREREHITQSGYMREPLRVDKLDNTTTKGRIMRRIYLTLAGFAVLGTVAGTQAYPYLAHREPIGLHACTPEAAKTMDLPLGTCTIGPARVR